MSVLMSGESDSGTAMEALSVLMDKRGLKGIVVLKGLPSTCKTEVALRIGRWAKCPVLCIQDFLGEGAGLIYGFEGAKGDFAPPTATDDEQVERHHRKAFACLLAVALRLLGQGGWHCVVIKSSLNTPYELQQLIKLAYEVEDEGSYKCKLDYKCRLIIMECKIRNKYLWKRRFEELIVLSVENTSWFRPRSWCRPRSWKDIDKVVDDDSAAHYIHHPPPWAVEHLQHLTDAKYVYPAWLGVDPFYDLALDYVLYHPGDPLPDEFNDAIRYLLTVPEEELPKNPYPYVVEYDEFRRILFDLKLSDAARSESFCKGDCVFRYCQVPEKYYEAEFCGVCQCEISSQPAYTCHFCVTTLDKTCAERFPTRILQSKIYDLYLCLRDEKPEQDPCKACQVIGKSFPEECRSCIFQDRLKCHLVPTILNHNFHPHFLSIQLVNHRCLCKACGIVSRNGLPGYGCKRCAFYLHIYCAFWPLEFKQVDGGHDHVMKLMYTRDAMEEEEDPIWCDHCYQDMNPELWFYTCQQCPHYVVHPGCSGISDLCLKDRKMVKVVEQLQSQLDDWRATGNSIQPC